MNGNKRLNIIAAADIHGKRSVYKSIAYRARQKEIDLVILAGDLTRYRDDALEEEIKEILNSIRKPVLFVMGNDDEHEWSSEGNLVNINEKRYIFNGVPFTGYQYSNPFIGGPFEKDELQQGVDLARLRSLVNEETVLVTHNPCYGILDEPEPGRHIGGEELLKLCNERKPKYHIFGHIHESAGVQWNHFNVSYPGKKSILKIEYYSGEYEFIKV
jgi:Icc-related predicted phosphoesterase